MALRANGKPRRRKYSFAFTGMVTCKCGKRLVGQIARGRYIYYGCSVRCGTPLIKESDLSAMFLEHLQAIRIDEDVAEWLLTAIKEFDAQRRADREQALARHQARQRQVQQKIDEAYDDKLSGRITED
jgi:Recombinase zinc beta ribbon domain